MNNSIVPSGNLFCLWQVQTIMQHIHGNIPYLFDYLLGPVGCSSPSNKELHGHGF